MTSGFSAVAMLALVVSDVPDAAGPAERASAAAPCAGESNCDQAPASESAAFRTLLENPAPVILYDAEGFRAFWNDFRCTSGSRLAAPRVSFGNERVLAQQGDGVSPQLEVKKVQKRGDKLVVVAKASGSGSAMRPRFVVAIPRSPQTVELQEIGADGSVTTSIARPWDGALRCASEGSASSTAPAALGELVAKAEALHKRPITASTRAELEALRQTAAETGVTAAFDEKVQDLFPSLYVEKTLGGLIAKAEDLRKKPITVDTRAELEPLRQTAAQIGVSPAFETTLRRLFPSLYDTRPGELIVESPNVFGVVVVNGKEIGYPPVVAKDVPSGLARVEIRVGGVVRKMKAARIEAGKRRQIVLD